MTVEIRAALVEHMLLGPPDDRRRMQDFALLGDVWTWSSLPVHLALVTGDGRFTVDGARGHPRVLSVAK
jgi:hypothetical protein